MEDGLDHAQRLVILCATPSDFINAQAHEEGMDAQQELIQVDALQRWQCESRVRQPLGSPPG